MFGVIGTFTILAISCFFDIRQRKIPLWIVGAGGIWVVINGVILVMTEGAAVTVQEILWGILPGAGLLLLGFLTENKVGYGDGILLVILGALEGGKTVFLTFCIGLFLQSLCAVGLILIKKADKQTKIPFVPFLLAARAGILFFK